MSNAFDYSSLWIYFSDLFAKIPHSFSTGIGAIVWLHTDNEVVPKEIHDDVITFSAWLVLCEGNPPVTDGFPSQRPVTQSIDVFITWTDGWANNRDVGDLRRHRAHFDVIVMYIKSATQIKPKHNKGQIDSTVSGKHWSELLWVTTLRFPGTTRVTNEIEPNWLA